MVMVSKALEPAQHERLLMVSGAIRIPERSDIVASRKIWKDMITALDAAMSLENPAQLQTIKTSVTYWDRLQRFQPDYAEFIETFDPTLGAAFQSAQMNAKNVLERRYPTTTITDVTGPHPVSVEPDGVEQLTFLLLADTVEDPERLIRDFAASALILPQVQVFGDCFPEAYSGLVQIAQELMAKKWPANKEDLPPLWMQDQLTILFQEPLESGLETKPPETKPASPQRQNVKLNVDAIKSPADAAL